MASNKSLIQYRQWSMTDWDLLVLSELENLLRGFLSNSTESYNTEILAISYDRCILGYQSLIVITIRY
jgi:hypothetical protein